MSEQPIEKTQPDKEKKRQPRIKYQDTRTLEEKHAAQYNDKYPYKLHISSRELGTICSAIADRLVKEIYDLRNQTYNVFFNLKRAESDLNEILGLLLYLKGVDTCTLPFERKMEYEDEAQGSVADGQGKVSAK